MVNKISQSNIRIKDIAEMAGVSTGTVDRVLHSRPNVSKSARDKVERVLEKINYSPNPYAKLLANNATYHFMAILPMHEAESYWARVENGLKKGVEKYTGMKIELKIFQYDPFDDSTFSDTFQKMLDDEPYAVIIAPILNKTVMTDCLHKLQGEKIPFAFIDSNWPEFNPVCFYGQNSIRSGEFSARILLMSVGNHPRRMCIFKVQGEGRIATQQQLDREQGFRDYVKAHCPACEVEELHLMAYDKDGMKDTMRKFFTENKDIECGITFNSTISTIGIFLHEEMPDYDIKLLGYDTVGRNIECLKEGWVDFIIAQHAEEQGLNCFRSLVNTTLLETEHRRDHYVAIELLTKENVDFYKD